MAELAHDASRVTAKAAAGAACRSTTVADTRASRFLVLGSGLVTGPLVKHLCKRPGNRVTCCSVILSEAEALATRFGPQVTPVLLDASKDMVKLERLVHDHDVVLSMLPAPLHMPVARCAIKCGRHMVTASYQTTEIQSLDAAAKEAGVTIVNEVGLDPGIDHMGVAAMVADIRREGGQVESFSSLCGGLPAPEIADNPLAYKFSWAPRGALTAMSNDAEYRDECGRVVRVAGERLLLASQPCRINPAFHLEVLPNRKCLKYLELYGITEAKGCFRGTLRYDGFSHVLAALKVIGLLDVTPMPELAPGAAPLSWRAFVTQLLGLPCDTTDAAVIDFVVRKTSAALVEAGGSELAADRTERIRACIEWLGLLSDREHVPRAGTALDALVTVLQAKPDMAYAKGERDMIIMHHTFKVLKATGHRELRESTLIVYGNDEATAMALTVGTTAGIAAQLLADGDINERGVVLPLSKQWYAPILARLSDEGIRMRDRVKAVAGGAGAGGVARSATSQPQAPRLLCGGGMRSNL